MAKTKISDFSATPGNNTDIDGINIAENCPPSGINDAIRELMAQLKDWQSGTSNDPYVVGSSGSLTLSYGTANGVAYLNGSKVLTTGSALTFDGTNLGLATSSVGSLGSSIPTFELKGAITTRTGGVRLRSSDNSMDGVFYGAAGLFYFGTSTNTDLAFTYGGSEQMRLTNTGLGIGTSNVTNRLTIGAGSFSATGTGNTGLYTDSSLGLVVLSDGFYVATRGGAGRFQLDSSGNLGLGVTPSAWVSSWKSVDVTSGGASLYGSLAIGGVGVNAYFDSGAVWRYKTSYAAGKYEIGSTGVHSWHTAPSGTAGNAISFTQAMTLDASGRLMLGRTNLTTNAGIFEVDGNGPGATVYTAKFSNSNTGSNIYNVVTWGQGQSGTAAGYIGTGGSAVGNAAFANSFVVGTQSSSPLVFNTGDTERARIDSSGNLLVGTTSNTNSAKVFSLATSSGPAFASQGYSGDVSAPAALFGKFDNNSTTSQVLVRFTINNNSAGSGQINANGANSAAFGSFSDSRLKENIADLQPQLANIMALRPVEFDYIESEGGGHQTGFIAQEMQEVYPDAVGERAPDGMLTITGWSKTEARLVKAIQELKAEFDAYKASHP